MARWIPKCLILIRACVLLAAAAVGQGGGIFPFNGSFSTSHEHVNRVPGKLLVILCANRYSASFFARLLSSLVTASAPFSRQARCHSASYFFTYVFSPL